MSFWDFCESETFKGTVLIFGGAACAGSWIYGASENLASAGCPADALLVLLCDGGVILTGGTVWLLWLAGCRLSVPLVIDILLAASFVFGVLAIWIMHLRGVLVLALDPSGKYPEWLAWIAPVVLLAIIATTRYPPARRRLLRTKWERDDRDAA